MGKRIQDVHNNVSFVDQHTHKICSRIGRALFSYTQMRWIRFIKNAKYLQPIKKKQKNHYQNKSHYQIKLKTNINK